MRTSPVPLHPGELKVTWEASPYSPQPWLPGGAAVANSLLDIFTQGRGDEAPQCSPKEHPAEVAQ